MVQKVYLQMNEREIQFTPLFSKHLESYILGVQKLSQQTLNIFPQSGVLFWPLRLHHAGSNVSFNIIIKSLK